ncbi:MAG: peptidoglycan DD-metalloendopeptidase family protein [Myxococcales bacterium]|nr:peptidoglycan DD-metalloendopeptidase family protein [Myxococcales bacterium]
MKLRVTLAVLALGSAAHAQNYRFPIQLPTSGTQPYPTAYRDLDSGGGLKDWNCGATTYDGHKGSDFGIGSWPVMDAGSRVIVAAADGKVVFVNDGCDDKCSTGSCGCGSGFGNYVKLQHADGKSTYYGHMMKGSLAVALNAEVKCGQALGKVGSSGNSTGPHLHFEVRYASNASDDPFSGSCGGPTSFWVSQGSYKGLPGDQCENPTPPEVDDDKQISESPTGSLSVAPGASFQKTWVIENTGTTTWSTAGGYALAHVGGDLLGATAPVALGASETVAPKAQKTWAVSFVAPSAPGTYGGDFRMNRSGKGAFGATLHLDVVVTEPGSGGASGGGGASGAAGTSGASPGGGGAPSSGGGGKVGSGGTKSGAEPDGSDDVTGGCACGAARDGAPRGLLASAALALFSLARRRRRAA